MSKRWGPLKGDHVQAHELAGALRKLITESGQSLARLEQVIPYRKSTISERVSGEIRPEWEFVEAVVLACESGDAHAQQILKAKFQRLWDKADPETATLLPPSTPQQPAPLAVPEVDPALLPSSDGRDSGRPSGDSWRWLKRWQVAVLLLAVLVCSGATAAVVASIVEGGNAASASSDEVSGEITCSSGNRVVGAWVHGRTVSGWATLENAVDGETRYSSELPKGEKYSLHIGCGGTPQNWAVGTHTVWVHGTQNSFNCFDVPNAPSFEECQTRGSY